MENVLEVKNIEKYYGNKSNLTKAIDNISFNVKNGEFVGIMGASGSGKTTLLNCVSTIDRVTAGHIIINGEDITKLKGNKLNKFRREELGFIFQDFNLLDTLTIYENIALALTIQKVNATEINNRVHEIAKKLDIEDEEIEQYGKYKAKLENSVFEKRKDKKDGKQESGRTVLSPDRNRENGLQGICFPPLKNINDVILIFLACL